MAPKRPSSRIDPINLPRRLREGLHHASTLLERGKVAEAIEILKELDSLYPNQVYVLEMLVEAYIQMQDDHNLLQAARRLHRLTPNRSNAKLALADAYRANMYPVLALITFRDFLKRWPQHEQAQEVREIVKTLEDGLPLLLAEAGLNIENDLEIASMHEEEQVCLISGEFDRAKALIEKIQKQRPNFIPPLNNLSQIYWLEGDLKRAIETCERVLAMDVDNLHAQANLIRYLYFAGRKDEAAPLIERLKASSAPAFDRWKKIAETLAFIGDDQGMLELAARAEKEADPSELREFFYHLVAVSECMLGNEKDARKHWQRALEIDPNFALASKNLDDLRKPIHERNGPWPFSIQQVIPQNVIQKIARFAEREAKRKKDENFQPAMRRFLDEHPEVLNMAHLLLKRGEAIAKEFVFMMAQASAHPSLLLLLKEYAFGQRGSDESRLKAAQILSQLEYIPSGEATLWIQGEWRTLLLLDFEITPEPVMDEKYALQPKTRSLMLEFMEAKRANGWTRAEDLSRRALSIQPEHPTLLTNLALALDLQGKKEERDKIVEHICKDFPDYFMGQMMYAKLLILKGDLEQARSILDYWLKTKKKYHVSEFDMLCKAQIEFFIQKENLDSAFSWLDLWENAEPDDPEFETYQKRLAALEKKTNRSRKKLTLRQDRGWTRSV